MGFRNLNRSAGTPATGGGGGGGSVNSVGVANATLVKTGTATDPLFAVVQATVAPLAIGTQTLGTSLKSAKEDHIHAHGNQLGGALHSVADGSNAGFMSAADFTKLAGIGAAAPPGTRTLTAGAGLTGGGDLSADRAFAVGAGTGITVNADDVAVATGSAFAWTAAHTFTASSVPVTSTITDASAATQIEGLRLRHQSSTAATVGIGVYQSFWASNNVAGGGTLAEAARIHGLLRGVINGSEAGVILFQHNVSGVMTNVGHTANGGFYGASTMNIGTLSATGVTTTLAQWSIASSMLNHNSSSAAQGGHSFTGTANTSGARSFFVILPSANTGTTASTAVSGFDYQTYTKTWATGAGPTEQMEFKIQAPTYAAAGASTFPLCSTLAITGAPIAGTNMTITQSLAFHVQSGSARFDGNVGFYGVAPAAQGVSGFAATNNVTVGGTDGTIANYTDLSVYANDAATIRNNIYQLAKMVKQHHDWLRAAGPLT